MKKKLSLIILSLLIPINIHAMELICPKGPYEKDNMFECILSDNAGYNYQELKANIISGEGLNCYVKNVEEGIINTSSLNNTISITGQSNTSNVLTIECGVTSEREENYSTTLSLEDFTYTLDSGIREDNLIIKSDFIDISAYSNVEIDTKPRDTSNPNTLLNDIKIDNVDFTFSKYILKYDIQVKYDIIDINVNYILNNETSNVTVVKPDVLAIGKNVVDLYITSEDGLSTTCYTINIIRLKDGEEPYYQEQDASLEFLVVNDRNLDFEYNKFIYEYKIEDDSTSVNIQAEPKIKNAEVNIVGNENLQNGSIISIYVKSVDGSITKEYKINIIKDIKNNNTIIYLIIGGGILLLIVIIVLIIIILGKKKKEEPKEEVVQMDEQSLDEAKKRIMNRVATPIPTQKVVVDTTSNNIDSNNLEQNNENQNKILNTNPNAQVRTIVINTKPINKPIVQSSDAVPTSTNESVVEPIETKTESVTPIINNIQFVDNTPSPVVTNEINNIENVSESMIPNDINIENPIQNDLSTLSTEPEFIMDNTLPVTPTTPKLPADQEQYKE